MLLMEDIDLVEEKVSGIDEMFDFMEKKRPPSREVRLESTLSRGEETIRSSTSAARLWDISTHPTRSEPGESALKDSWLTPGMMTMVTSSLPATSRASTIADLWTVAGTLSSKKA
ncbi:hypothetical protein [Candidatus Methanocrinis natronophilus]|uniref:Uncharacterized protein n=1 Tax=Candidatus Methanocrinis natronophilus TaxID=3033396 RepID=A0ABT5X9A0_9EURY|nr:hypothetical protein [Candidatus Methanocrinis natronophilus]MDF0591284.1 hypothetical protein [Candidatus Methanocrinis natronophilus]